MSIKERLRYDFNAPVRHAAALDREHAKGDREAAPDDQGALSKDHADAGDPEAT